MSYILVLCRRTFQIQETMEILLSLHSVTLTRHFGLIFTFNDKGKGVMFLSLSNIKRTAV